MSDLSPPVADSPIALDAQQKPLVVLEAWVNWLYEQWNRVRIAAYRLGSVVRLTGQHASIAATPLSLPALSAGRYRLSWYARITTVDPVSSSLTVTLGWTESALPLSLSGAAMTGNSVGTVQSGSVFAELDGNSAVTYATTYVSNSPGTMQYRLSVEVEALP